MKLRNAPLAFSLVFAATAAVSIAQDAAWQFSYDYSPRPGFYPVALKPTSDGGMVIAAIARNFPLDAISSPSNVVIAKFTENGDRTWVVTRPLPGSFQGTFVDPDLVGMDVDSEDNVYLVEPRNGSSRLIRFLPDGALDWQIPVGTNLSSTFQELITHVDASSPGEIVVAGTHMYGVFFPYVQMQSYEPDGTLRFSIPATTSAFTQQMLVNGMERGPSGEVYLRGYLDTQGPAGRFGVVRRYNSNGVESWMWLNGNSTGFTKVNDVAAAPSGATTIVATRFLNDGSPEALVLARVDSGGTEVFEFLYEPIPGAEVAAESLALLPGGGFVVAGSIQRSGPGSPRSLALMYFDAAGQEVGVSFLPNVALEAEGSAEHVAVDEDGHVLVLGWSADAVQEGVVASFDSTGNSRWVQRIEGSRPIASLTTSTSSAIGFDVRGNAFSLSQDIVSGGAPNQDLSLRLRKTVLTGEVGAAYCGPAVPNSTGVPGVLKTLGRSEVANDNVSLVASDLPGGVFTLFLGSQLEGDIPGAGGGQGTLCLGGAIGRFLAPGQVRRASGQGDASLQINLGDLPQPMGAVQAVAGQTWRFQAWHRDANPSATSNFTNGVELLLQ